MSKSKRIISALTALSLMSSFAVVSKAEEVKEWRLAESAVVSTPSEWGSNVFGDWSFWSIAEYYNAESAVTSLPDERTYVNLDDVGTRTDRDKISPAGDFTHKGVIKLGNYDTMYGPGLVMSAKNDFPNDSLHYNSDMIIYPNAADGMVRFRSGNTLGNDKDVAVMFTVPETGSYNVYLDATNKGQLGTNGLRGYGNSNFGRLSIVAAGESSETSANSIDFAIPNKNVDTTVEYNNTATLTKGTRLFLRMHNGHHWDVKDLQAKLVITKYDADGNTEKVYDLNKVGYSAVENSEFLSADKGVTDTTTYQPMFAANPTNVTTAPGYTDGYVAPVAGNNKWAGSKVNMTGVPSFGWGDGVIEAKAGDSDIIWEWEVPESGAYKIADTITASSSNTADISFTTYKNSTLLSSYTLSAGTSQDNKLNMNMNKGDKLVFRVSGTSSDALTFAPIITKYADKSNNLSENATVTQTPSEWGTNVFGEWSFWSIAEYYNAETVVKTLPDVSERTYANLDDVRTRDDREYISPAGDFTHKGMQKANGSFIEYYKSGIVMSAKNDFVNDSLHYNSDMITYPNSADEMTRFRAGNNLGNDKDVAVMFTIPETGSYNIYLDATNKGQLGDNGLRGYGDSNFGRLSIVAAGESSETSANSIDFAIPGKNADTGAEYNNTAILTQGTRVFLRMHNGNHWDMKDLHAKFIITKYDANGNKEKVYDLNKVGYSSVDKISFSRADKSVTDTSTYLPMFAANPANVTTAPGYTGGYVAPVATDVKWASSKVNMTGTPSVGWNTSDLYFTVTTGAQDMIIEWTPESAGVYNTEVSAYTEDGTPATVSVTKLAKGVTTDTDNKFTLSAGAGETSNSFEEILKADDKILVRVSSETTGKKVYVKIVPEKTKDLVYADITEFGAVGDGETDNTEAIHTAISYAKALEIPVYVPAGIFVHEGIIFVDGVKMFGEGYNLSVLKGTTYKEEAVELSGNSAGLYNLKVVATRGSRNAYTGGCAVAVLENATNFEINNCYVEGGSGAGINVHSASNGKILNNTVTKTAADGIFVYRGSNNIEVAYNLVSETRDDAIAFTSFVNDVNNGYAITKDNTVHHNTIYSVEGIRGISVNGGENISIYNNYIDGTGANICVGADSSWGSTQNKNIYIYDNTLKNTIYMPAQPAFGGAVTLRNDQGEAGGNNGVSEEIYIYGNDIYNPLRSAILAYGTYEINAMVYGNNFYLDTDVPEYINNNDSAAMNIDFSEGNSKYALSAYTTDKNQLGDGFSYEAKLNLPETNANLLKNAEISVSNGNADLLTDGLKGTACTDTEIVVDFGEVKAVNTVMVYDDAKSVTAFDVYVKADGEWTKAVSKTSDDKIKTAYFETVETDVIKVVLNGENVSIDELIAANAGADVSDSTVEFLYTPWTFSFGPVFYTNDGDSFIYQDMESDFEMAYDFTSLDSEVFITGQPYNHKNRDYAAYLAMNNTQGADLTYYATASKVNNKDNGIATCFIVPEDGCYTVDWYLVNKGNGTGNFARVSVLEDGVTMETAENTHDFEVTSAGSTYNSDVYALSKGDKIWTRVYSGSGITGDEIYGSLKISETTVSGTPLKVYDLNHLKDDAKLVNGEILGVGYANENGYADLTDGYTFTADESGFYRVILSGLSENGATIKAVAGGRELSLETLSAVTSADKIFSLTKGDKIVISSDGAVRARVEIAKVTADVLTEFNKDGVKINKIADSFDAVKYFVNPTSSEKTVTVWGAIYDGDVLKSITVYENVTLAAESESYKTYSVSVDKSYQNPEFKMFVWDGEMIPYNIATELN